MTGDELPSGQGGVGRPLRIRILGWILLIYTVWSTGCFVNSENPVFTVGSGVGLVGLAVIATRPSDRRD